MKYSEFREAAERIHRDYRIPMDEVDFEVSMDPKEIPAEDGVRYFGDPHELMCCQGAVMICVSGDRNIPANTQPSRPADNA